VDEPQTEGPKLEGVAQEPSRAGRRIAQKHTMIKDTKTYSLLEIVELGVLGKTPHTVSSAILRDAATDGLLETTVTGTDQGTRYSILGRNLKRYIKHREATERKGR
jgi:hypothetical protein